MKSLYKQALILAALVGFANTGRATVIYDTYNLADLLRGALMT